MCICIYVHLRALSSLVCHGPISNLSLCLCSGHDSGSRCSKQITMRASQILLSMQKRQDAQAKVALLVNRLQNIGAPGGDKFKGRRHEAPAIKINLTF